MRDMIFGCSRFAKIHKRAKLCYYSSSKIIRWTNLMSNYLRIKREKRKKQQKKFMKPTKETWVLRFDLGDQGN